MSVAGSASGNVIFVKMARRGGVIRTSPVGDVYKVFIFCVLKNNI